METKYTKGLIDILTKAADSLEAQASSKGVQNVLVPKLRWYSTKVEKEYSDLLEALIEINTELDKFWNGNKSERQIKNICQVQQKCSGIIKKAIG